MKGRRLLAAICAAAMIAGCEPSLVVENNTAFGIRVIVSQLAGKRDVVSPSAGSSSGIEASEGTYTAVAIVDTEWVAEARRVRSVLSDRLGAHLRGERPLDDAEGDEIVRLIEELGTKLVEFEQAAPAAARCDGRVSQDASGVISVSQDAEGRLVATCK